MDFNRHVTQLKMLERQIDRLDRVEVADRSRGRRSRYIGEWNDFPTLAQINSIGALNGDLGFCTSINKVFIIYNGECKTIDNSSGGVNAG